MTTDKPPRRRRWIPVSLRIFVVMLVLLGLGTAAFGLSVWLPYHREKLAVKTIESCGGSVSTVKRSPEWLRRVVGNARSNEFKIFARIDSVDLNDATITDAEIAQMGGCSSLEVLLVGRTEVTDDGLALLSELTNLEILTLNETAVTDAGLAHLSGLTKLKLLVLDDTPVTDAGLAKLSGNTKLERLYLSGTLVSDSGLVHLSKLTKLRRLGLERTMVTSKGIEELRKALPDCVIHH
jgi:hypothetical protein